MKFYYVNSRGERLNFYEYPYCIQGGDLLDYRKSYTTIGTNGRSRIRTVTLEPVEKTLQLAVIPEQHLPIDERQKVYKDAVNHILEVTEYDVVNDVDGKLWTDSGYYLSCRIVASRKGKWIYGKAFMTNDLTILSAAPIWTKPISPDVYLGYKANMEAEYLDYPTDYAYDYLNQTTLGTVKNTNYLPANFIMVIGGPINNPSFYIAEHLYNVDVEIGKDEYLVIDSVNKTIILHKEGSTVNCFNARNRDSYVFERIPPGTSTFLTNDKDLNLTLTLLDERSEPAWI